MKQSKAKASHHPPSYCNNGMCNRDSHVAKVEVQKKSGERIIVPFSVVCQRDAHGNATHYLAEKYTYVRWHTWCIECFSNERTRKEFKQPDLLKAAS